jgi:uncharacterized protein DUF6600/FecR-like protein
MKNVKVWPHLTIIGVVIALLAGLGVAWWMKHEPTASAETLPNAARIQRVDGEVAFSDALVGNDSYDNAQWVAATQNQPFSVGDRIYTRDNSRTSLAFTGRNFARLDPNTALDVVNLYDGRTQVALREGSAFFDVGYLDDDDLFEVATPYGAVDLVQPGLYNVGFDNNGNVLVSVLSGLAQVVGLSGSGQISKGEMLTLAGQTAADVILSRLDGRNAGYLVDDYYRYQYPNAYDGRYSNYDAYLNDPYYYDPYRRNTSYQYVSSVIPGVNDLDYYGDWQNIDNYGYAWRPRVDTNWAPYQQGSWVNDYPYGMTWVSNEPWGYAPYHYGRWANVGNQWYWIPERANTTPMYAPALVAFLPLNGANEVGWVPLGPSEPYAYRYYDENWQPHYVTRVDVVPAQLVNLAIPGAVTVVPVDAFGRVIDPRMVRRVDPQMLASVRPTLEPLLLTPLRNAALHSAWGRGKIDLPPGIAKKLDGRQVFVGAAPVAPFFRKDLAKALRVESLPDKVKKEKFKVRDDRGGSPGSSGKPEDVARKQEIDRLSHEASKGNRDAERQVRQLEQQQRKAQVDQDKAARKAAQQPQAQRVGNPVKQEAPRVERQQAPQAPKHEMKHQSQAGADAVKQERKQERQAQPSGQGQGQGGGKGKGKGKP